MISRPHKSKNHKSGIIMSYNSASRKTASSCTSTKDDSDAEQSTKGEEKQSKSNSGGSESGGAERSTSSKSYRTSSPQQEQQQEQQQQQHHAGSGKNSFPWKLYRLLEDAETDSTKAKVISWLPDGSGFKVHKPTEFVQNLLVPYFKTQTKLKSFTRQLYIYGFSKVPSGPTSGAFYHPLFTRGNNTSLLLLKRNKCHDRRFKRIVPGGDDGGSSQHFPGDDGSIGGGFGGALQNSSSCGSSVSSSPQEMMIGDHGTAGVIENRMFDKNNAISSSINMMYSSPHQQNLPYSGGLLLGGTANSTSGIMMHSSSTGMLSPLAGNVTMQQATSISGCSSSSTAAPGGLAYYPFRLENQNNILDIKNHNQQAASSPASLPLTQQQFYLSLLGNHNNQKVEPASQTGTITTAGGGLIGGSLLSSNSNHHSSFDVSRNVQQATAPQHHSNTIPFQMPSFLMEQQQLLQHQIIEEQKGASPARRNINTGDTTTTTTNNNNSLWEDMGGILSTSSALHNNHGNGASITEIISRSRSLAPSEANITTMEQQSSTNTDSMMEASMLEPRSIEEMLENPEKGQLRF